MDNTREKVWYRNFIWLITHIWITSNSTFTFASIINEDENNTDQKSRMSKYKWSIIGTYMYIFSIFIFNKFFPCISSFFRDTIRLTMSCIMSNGFRIDFTRRRWRLWDITCIINSRLSIFMRIQSVFRLFSFYSYVKAFTKRFRTRG